MWRLASFPDWFPRLSSPLRRVGVDERLQKLVDETEELCPQSGELGAALPEAPIAFAPPL
jgi:hypothetical protein